MDEKKFNWNLVFVSILCMFCCKETERQNLSLLSPELIQQEIKGTWQIKEFYNSEVYALEAEESWLGQKMRINKDMIVNQSVALLNDMDVSLKINNIETQNIQDWIHEFRLPNEITDTYSNVTILHTNNKDLLNEVYLFNSNHMGFIQDGLLAVFEKIK